MSDKQEHADSGPIDVPMDECKELMLCGYPVRAADDSARLSAAESAKLIRFITWDEADRLREMWPPL